MVIVLPVLTTIKEYLAKYGDRSPDMSYSARRLQRESRKPKR